MMKLIEVLRGCGASGASLRPGEIAEVSDEDARILIGLGKAAFPRDVGAGLKPAPTAEPAGLDTTSAAALVEGPRKKIKA